MAPLALRSIAEPKAATPLFVANTFVATYLGQALGWYRPGEVKD
jgi:hypothetical protein